jgi:nitrile hydratase
MRKVDLEVVRGLYKNPGAARLDSNLAARFQVGDKVRARNIHPEGHTRLPRYCRGREGVIARANGVFHLPDALAHGEDEHPQHNYSIRFDARELWGGEAPAGDCLYIDLWEDYLEPA